jgi:hypothetical protein
VRVQIPRGDLVPALKPAGRITKRNYYMQKNYLGMKAVRQPGGLLSEVLGSSAECIRKDDGKENLTNAQHALRSRNMALECPSRV